MENLDASSELESKFKPSELSAVDKDEMNVAIPQKDSINNHKEAVMIIEAPSNVVADFHNEVSELSKDNVEETSMEVSHNDAIDKAFQDNESESRILKESETSIDICQNDAVVDAPQNPVSELSKDNVEETSMEVSHNDAIDKAFQDNESESRILKESETSIDICQNFAVVDAPQNPVSELSKDNVDETSMEVSHNDAIDKAFQDNESESRILKESETSIDICQNDAVVDAPQNPVSELSKDNVEETSMEVSHNDAIDKAFQDNESESRILKESETSIDINQNDAVVDAPQNPVSELSKDNVDETSMEVSHNDAIDKAFQDNESESRILKESETSIDICQNDAVVDAPQNPVSELSKDNVEETSMEVSHNDAIDKAFQDNESESRILKESETSIDINQNDAVVDAPQNPNSNSLKNKETENIKDPPSEDRDVEIDNSSQDDQGESLKDNEVETLEDAPQTVAADAEAAEDLNAELLKTNNIEIIKETSIAINDDLQDKDSELLKGKETEIVNNIPSNIPIDETAQNNGSGPLKDNEIEIIKEALRNVVVERISIVSSESSDDDDDEFEKMIESAIQEAFVDNDSDSTKNNQFDKKTDIPKKNTTGNTSKDYDSESSDDDEFEKMIENAVQEAFQDNDASSPKSNEKDKDEVTNSHDANVVEEISQNQLSDSFNKNVVEMSIDIPQNEEINEVSRDDIVRPFARKKIKVECNSPEPDESTVPIKESAGPPEEENFEGEHAFSFTVSYYDSEDPQNCAVYSEPKSRLYISKEFEFQVLCSAASVPQGSVLRACVHFAAPTQADKIVKRCAPHIREDILSGKLNAEHVIQSSHVEVEYEKDKDSGRFNVVIPYQCSQGPFQGCAELSCYTYKFVCWSSCYRIIQRGFKVHFTLENNGMCLGKQILDVKVCKCPEKEMEADSENPHVADVYSHVDGESPSSSSRMLQDFLIPALDSKKYGNLLHWGDEPGLFFIKWVHKMDHRWSRNELAVFKDWDALKGRPEAVNDIDIVSSKQRVRVALANLICVKNMDCYEKGYRKYIIKNIDYIRGSIGRPQRTKSLDSFEEVKQSKGERRTSRKVEPIAYEEAVDDIVADDEEDCGNVPKPPTKKPRKLSRTKGKKRKRPAFSKRKKSRTLSQSAKQIRSISTVTRKSSSIVKKKTVGAKTRSNGGQKLIMDGDFKKGNVSPTVELKRLTLQDLLQAGIKMDVIEKYFGQNKDYKNQKNHAFEKIVLPPKSILRRQLNRFMDHPVNSVVESTHQFPPMQRNVFTDQGINFEATPYAIHAPSAQSPSPLCMPALSWKEEKPNKMLNTYSNIKTQGDMILALIKAVLPSLQSDKVSEIYDYLVEMGVETADDLAYIEEDDLNRVLKPIQSRKLIAAWKNKGIPNHSASLPKRTCGTEPVTFVPAVFQIQNMTSQNQMNDSHRVFSAESESPQQNAVLNIPGWRQSISKPSVQDVYPDLAYAAALKNEASPANETPLPLPSSSTSKEWTDTFEIPWKKLPQEAMHCLLKKKLANRRMRSTIIDIICKDIFEITKYPLQRQMEEIVKKIWNRFPESLFDGDISYKNPGNEYVLLTNQMLNRMKVLRRQDARKPELSEDKKQKQWLSKNYKKYGKKLDADLAPPNLKSSVHSTESYSTSSSKYYASSAPNFSFASSAPSFLYTPSTQSAMSTTSLAPSSPYNSVMPGAKSYISSAASDNLFTSSTRTADSPCPSNRDIASPSADCDFVVPWQKLSEVLLGSLDGRKELSIFQRRDLVRVVSEEFVKWEPKALNNIAEESRKIAKLMLQRYPSSLSNASFGQAGGKTSSSSLAKLLSTKILRLKSSKRLAKKASSSEQKIKTVVPPDSVEGVLDWAVNFRIPWEKMPYTLLEGLRNKERLSPTLRQEMVRIICSDIQNIEENPSKECIDFIAKKMCKMYPKSLCDMCGDNVGGKSEFLGRQLLWRIQRVNYASKSFVQQETFKYATADPDGLDTITSADSLIEFLDINSMDNMEVVNVVPDVDDSSAITYPNNMNVNGYYGLNTNSYNAISDYMSTDYTTTSANSGNNTTPYIYHLEQLIKREVEEQDQRFAVKMFPGSEPRHSDGEIL